MPNQTVERTALLTDCDDARLTMTNFSWGICTQLKQSSHGLTAVAIERDATDLGPPDCCTMARGSASGGTLPTFSLRGALS